MIGWYGVIRVIMVDITHISTNGLTLIQNVLWMVVTVIVVKSNACLLNKQINTQIQNIVLQLDDKAVLDEYMNIA